MRTEYYTLESHSTISLLVLFFSLARSALTEWLADCCCRCCHMHLFTLGFVFLVLVSLSIGIYLYSGNLIALALANELAFGKTLKIESHTILGAGERFMLPTHVHTVRFDDVDQSNCTESVFSTVFVSFPSRFLL